MEYMHAYTTFCDCDAPSPSPKPNADSTRLHPSLERHDMAHLSRHVSFSVPPMLIDCECDAGAAKSNCEVKGRRIQF